ncbi:hypothetical protein ACHAW6_008769 [Cyclotella cf. meneghiniana]
MELNPSGQVKSLDQISIDRNREGYCQTCHIDPIRCFEIRKVGFGILQQRNPLTMPGLVHNGICLRCHPHTAGKQQDIHSNESSRRPSRQRYRGGGNSHEPRALLVRQNATRDFRTYGGLPARANLISDESLHNGQSSFDQLKKTNDAEEENNMDQLEKIIAQYNARTQGPLKFIPQNGAFLPAELEVNGTSDETSVLTMPSVFDEDRSVTTRGVMTRSAQTSFRGTGELFNVDECSGSTSGNCSSVASYGLRAPPVTVQSERNYFESTEESSPDLDAVRAVVKDCMLTGNENEAIEAVRQALMKCQSVDTALFCLTSLWILVRKSDENKWKILKGSDKKKRGDETPFYAIIEVMLKFSFVDIQIRACGVLWSLSMNPDCRKDVAQLGGCQAILHAMLTHTHSESLHVMALGALKVLSFNVVGKSTLRLIEASLVVADSMFKHIANPTIQLEGCAVISNLATEPNNFVSAVTEREISAIINSILSHPASSNIQEAACLSLARLALSVVNVETIQQNPRVFKALDVAFQKHPDVVGRYIQILLGKLREHKVEKI